MRRHLSARLGLGERNTVLRFSSAETSRTTRPRRYHGNPQRRQRMLDSNNVYRTRYAKKSIVGRQGTSSFQSLRACYFSNVQQTQNENSNDAISNQLAHLFVDEEDPTKFNYIKTLKSWYLENHGETGAAIQEAFLTEMITNPNDNEALVDGTIRQLFTASFTCPITQEKFEAGRLTGYFDIQNQNFYSRKKVALQAVSAVVLSHKTSTAFDSQKSNDQTYRQILQRLYMKRFKTSPTKSQNRVFKQDFVGKTNGGTWWTSEFTCPITHRVYEAADLPDVSDELKMTKAGRIWYRKMSDSIHASASNAIESIDWDAELHELKNQPPAIDESKELLRPLSSWYAEQDENSDVEISVDDNFVITENNDLFTASFLCPLTGERFDAGTINATDATVESDNLVWYTKQNAAIQAASQRSYDVFHYRSTGVKDPRFCKEDPDEHAPDEVLETVVVAADDQEMNDLTEDELTDDEDEDDFVIRVIPQQIIPGSHSGSSMTLDIIAKAWIDSTGVSKFVEGNPEDRIENFQNAFAERSKAIARAMEWISRQDTKNSKLSGDRTQFDVHGEMGNLKIANAILSSLAECHQRVPFDSQTSGVEECAVAVLESMWASNSTKPDAQSYAFYLKCLEGETPSEIAAKAQAIVDAMESGQDDNQRILPKPNDAIYGSLFEIKALSGYDLVLERSDITTLDRNTHLCKLSAMAHDPSTFDMDFAARLIDQMKTLSETNNEPSMHPDHETYNAPLRWSGGHLWSRPYSRVIPWDSYGEIYKNGFQSDSQVDVEQKYAEKVEQWIETMTTKALSDSAVAPNIETFESLIQALVRCGNRESLLKAESIATSILSGEYSGIQPRIQTFYPILAAWTHSGCEEGPQRVESWMNRLEELMPNLEPRLAFPNVSVMAQISLQRQLLAHLRDSVDVDSSRIEISIFDGASKCSEFLTRSIEGYKTSPNSPIQTDVFMLVINAWYNAASAAILQENLDEAKKCLKEIQATVEQFDDLLVWLHQVGEPTTGDAESTDLHSEFLRLLNLAPSVYGAQLSTVSVVEKDEASEYCDKTLHLISIEEKIRRLEEFHQFWGIDSSGSNEDGTLKGKSNVDVGSIFPSEEFLGDFFCKSWSDYIDSTLDILEKGTNDSSIGEADFVRLSMSIARITSGASLEVLNSLAKDRIIEKVVKILEDYCGNDQNRKSVISTVIQSLKKPSVNPGSSKVTAHSTASKYGASDEFPQQEKDQIVDDNSSRRVSRRDRPHGKELKSRSSYSRSKTSSRSLRRRPRPRHAKQNDSS